MKRKQVNEILSFQTTRRRNVCLLVFTIIITFLVSFFFLISYIDGNKYHYVKYNEKNNTSYKVYLKENDFFNSDYLEKDNEYISSLINKIEANFKYELSVEENVTYSYSYRIESNVIVKRKDSSEYLYNKTETILDTIENSTNKEYVKIEHLIPIDYNKHNNLMKKFINIYSLDDIESTLTVNMYINVIGACNSFVEDATKQTVISLKIPLTTRVLDVEQSDNLMNNQNNLIECKKESENTNIFLILFITFALIALILVYITIRYIVKTRTAENIYQREMKKILNNYGSYIQTLSNIFDLQEYKLLHIDSFHDMLEISETISQPILLKENEEKTGAYFLILTNFGVIYIYRLKVSVIEEAIKNNK